MESKRQPIDIAGGGLAGLSLGIALRRRDIPVTVWEANTYPRHKVCGEFIAGLRDRTIESLGMRAVLVEARQHRNVSWFRGDEAFRMDQLARPALGISRYELDRRLSALFIRYGGRLVTRTRRRLEDARSEGTVWAAGRARSRSKWIGLKAHYFDLKLTSDLELHLGDGGYVGASAVEGRRTNVCGLFRLRDGIGGKRKEILDTYIRLAGLDDLSNRLKKARRDDASVCAVAGLGFGPIRRSHGGVFRLGDAFALLPPFTGNGMAMAFEGAEAAIDPLVSYAAGRISWPEACIAQSRRLRIQFFNRHLTARILHRFLLLPRWQSVFHLASRTGLLPFRPILRTLHA